MTQHWEPRTQAVGWGGRPRGGEAGGGGGGSHGVGREATGWGGRLQCLLSLRTRSGLEMELGDAAGWFDETV